jgi:ribosomal protein L32
MDADYVLLGVPKTATRAEIASAYRRLAKKCHPDKNLGDPTAAQTFRFLVSAYERVYKKAPYIHPQQDPDLKPKPSEGVPFPKETPTKCPKCGGPKMPHLIRCTKCFDKKEEKVCCPKCGKQKRKHLRWCDECCEEIRKGKAPPKQCRTCDNQVPTWAEYCIFCKEKARKKEDDYLKQHAESRAEYYSRGGGGGLGCGRFYS